MRSLTLTVPPEDALDLADALDAAGLRWTGTRAPFRRSRRGRGDALEPPGEECSVEVASDGSPGIEGAIGWLRARLGAGARFLDRADGMSIVDSPAQTKE